jgi:predicted transcriptional regulator
MQRELINQIRELLERHLDVLEIAHRLNLDIETVKFAVSVIKEIIT